MNETLLRKQLEALPHLDYPFTSRIHPLHSFPTGAFVKREDELGFGISGMKIRKYRTLIPYLIEQGCQEAVVLGGPFSNHVLSITQLLIENKIRPTLFLRGGKPAINEGNFLFLQALGPTIHWISKERWISIDAIVSEYISNRPCAVILPEGGSLFPAFLGAMSLPLDILRNEKESGIHFNSVYLDAGTGYSAAALLLAFAYLKKQTHCHLLLLADDEKPFRSLLKTLHAEFENWLGTTCPYPTQFTCYRSPAAPSFGATNKTLFKFIVEIAKLEGFFLDPIYSGKLFYLAWQQLSRDRGIKEPTEKMLLIHSGGALTLAGFQKQLEKAISQG